MRSFDSEEIMALCDWKTDARYSIVNAARLLKRAAQLTPAANGNLTATLEGTATPAGRLS